MNVYEYGNKEHYNQILVRAYVYTPESQPLCPMLILERTYSDQFDQFEILCDMGIEAQYSIALMGYDCKCEIRCIELEYSFH